MNSVLDEVAREQYASFMSPTLLSQLYRSVPDDITESHAEMTALRRDLHAHPELRYNEHRTAALVAAQLDRFGIATTTGVGGTGVVGSLVLGRGGASILLRADMDALPITERNRFAHRSSVPGCMHACGHDGHTAMLLTAARHLAKRALGGGAGNTINAVVHFVFQPAEEGGAGAKAMIDDGLFTRFPTDAVFALHNLPTLPPGHFAIIDGAAQASSNEFEVVVNGQGAHGAMPHEGVDVILAASQIVANLQSVISRNVCAQDAAVLSVCQFNAGHAVNVLPDSCVLRGTIRAFDDAVLDHIEMRATEIVAATALAFGAQAKFVMTRKYPTTINSSQQVALAWSAVNSVVGQEAQNQQLRPLMAADDFAFMLRERPGAMVYIGNGDGSHRRDNATDSGETTSADADRGQAMLHSAHYDFNDALIPIGAAFWNQLVSEFSAATSKSTSPTN